MIQPQPFMLLALSLAVASAPASAQPCQGYWHTLSLPGQPSAVWGIDVYDSGTGPTLHASGWFVPENGGETVRGTFRRVGSSWEQMTAGVVPPATVSGLFRRLNFGDGERLCTSGTLDGQYTSVRLFCWSGHEWEVMPDGLFTQQMRPEAWLDHGQGPVVYGSMTTAPLFAPSIFRWGGQAWDPIGSTLGGNIRWMLVHDDGSGPALYVGGNFNSVNSLPGTRSIARWDGLAWSSVGGGLTGKLTRPHAAAVFDDGQGPKLYTLGGNLTPEGQNLICVWDGKAWSHVGIIEVPPFTGAMTTDIIAHDDGAGPGLVVAGSMAYISGVHVRGLGRWDGQSWSGFGVGPGSGAAAMFKLLAAGPDPRGPSLFGIGYFTAFGAGQVPAGTIAQWVGCPNCYPDCDENGALNVEDFVCFMQRFAARHPYANCNTDASIDTADFSCFIQKFAQGCP